MNIKINNLVDGKIVIPPFANTEIGDVLLFSDIDDYIMIFNKKVLEDDMKNVEKLTDALKEKRTFLRNLGSSISYSGVVEEDYTVTVNQKLIEKYNLKDGYTLEEEGHHLIFKGININHKKTR